MTLRLDPYECKPNGTPAMFAWCYEDNNGLKVYIQHEDGTILACTVSRRTIETYLKHILMKEGADLTKSTEDES